MKPAFLTAIKVPLARDIMQPKIISVPFTAPITELAKILSLHKISGVPVTDEDGKVIGVVSQSDLALHTGNSSHDPLEWVTPARAIALKADAQPTVANIMTRGVHHVSEYETLANVIRLMQKEHIHRVLVTDGEEVIGLISTTDVIAAVPDLLDQYGEALSDASNYIPD